MSFVGTLYKRTFHHRQLVSSVSQWVYMGRRLQVSSQRVLQCQLQFKRVSHGCFRILFKLNMGCRLQVYSQRMLQLRTPRPPTHPRPLVILEVRRRGGSRHAPSTLPSNSRRSRHCIRTSALLEAGRKLLKEALPIIPLCSRRKKPRFQRRERLIV